MTSTLLTQKHSSISNRLSTVTVLFLLALASSTYAQITLPPRPADPYADPAHDIYNPLRYIASNALTSVAFGTRRETVMIRMK